MTKLESNLRVIPCEINKYLEKWLHHHLRLTKKNYSETRPTIMGKSKILVATAPWGLSNETMN